MRYYVGWDVGAWHCDRNAESRDALVVLTDEPAGLIPVGRPFWGNLRPDLSAHCGPELLSAILGRCDVPLAGAEHVVVTIDTPLAWPTAALRLLASGTTAAVPEASQDDPYLFRQSERLLFQHGYRPLSVVRDMISSQSLKGIHTLQRLGARQERVGVWTLRAGSLQVDLIETYPAPYAKLADRRDAQLETLVAQIPPTKGSAARLQDTRDALFCAWLGSRFLHARESLLPPDADAPTDEGWIWLPREVYDRSARPTQR